MNTLTTKLILVVLLVSSLSVYGQIQFPDPSFASTLRQKAGFTTFTVDYERPMQRGRPIFGALVPFGKPWKTGAGFHNRISFDRDVFMGGKQIRKGTYHLVSIPDINSWKVILTTDSIVFEKNKPYEPEKEVARIEVKPQKSARHYEAFTIDIDVVNNDAHITYGWDYTTVSFVIETRTTAEVMKKVREMIKQDSRDAVLLGDAAEFVARHLAFLPPSAKDTALLLINKAIIIKPEGWMYRTRRDIFLFSKDVKGMDNAMAEFISWIRKSPDEQADQEIKRLEDEHARFKRAMTY
jgi:hypothetical protein